MVYPIYKLFETPTSWFQNQIQFNMLSTKVVTPNINQVEAIGQFLNSQGVYIWNIGLKWVNMVKYSCEYYQKRKQISAW